MEEVSNGKRICKRCLELLPFYKFRKQTWINKDGSEGVCWEHACKKCKNEIKRIELVDSVYYIEQRSKKEVFDQTKKDSEYKGVHFGHKNEFYWEIENEMIDPVEESLKKLLSLTFNDLSQNELIFYRRYERRNKKFRIKRNNKQCYITFSSPGSERHIRRFKGYFCLPSKFKKSY